MLVFIKDNSLNYGKCVTNSVVVAYFRSGGQSSGSGYGASGAAPREARGRPTGLLPDVLAAAEHPPRALSAPPSHASQSSQATQPPTRTLRRPVRRKDSVARLTLSGVSYLVTVSISIEYELHL